MVLLVAHQRGPQVLCWSSGRLVVWREQRSKVSCYIGTPDYCRLAVGAFDRLVVAHQGADVCFGGQLADQLVGPAAHLELAVIEITVVKGCPQGSQPHSWSRS